MLTDEVKRLSKGKNKLDIPLFSNKLQSRRDCIGRVDTARCLAILKLLNLGTVISAFSTFCTTEGLIEILSTRGAIVIVGSLTSSAGIMALNGDYNARTWITSGRG